MRTADDILRKAKQLPARERQRIVNALTRMEKATRKRQRHRTRKPGVRLRGWELWEAMAGKGHSVHTDVSSNKYKHLAEIYADSASTK